MNQPKRAGRAGGIILLAFLSLFALTNFLTLILSMVAAGQFWPLLHEGPKTVIKIPFPTDSDGPWPPSFPDFLRQLQPVTVSEPFNLAGNSARPYVLLAALAGITWVITSIAILLLFTKIRSFNHRVARYVFRVIGTATSVFLVIFYLTYAHAVTFIAPFRNNDWPMGRGGAIMAHFNLLLGIFITLLAAALDTPKDWDASTGPNSGRTSQA
ncbi:hypothetical protein FVEG_06932 [Fusarium verticillioides 7600]|uniref:Uncharacterized protein n=1 Tax=Gibberella moniliformis (strain M3125 / FGSC 7600) TaxID=334819 RepID=W7MPA8_GIBM7|nr:hypothetical protein FVEG_06932 [Fusarium verticillioides 7600]EWG46447.1 hypothetical protein FVEG_06932 [Fusarium verticillioides 7600]RBQ65278.1 hypothetical protein FVER14953_06932 [Fusarium verticillioides]RBQ95420.1 hypothetical protein FVER53263_06932 [Fusarium verticillioides]RBR06467.1 hypothetical protein FVER53590_06932 [Fusarium verticillioides]